MRICKKQKWPTVEKLYVVNKNMIGLEKGQPVNGATCHGITWSNIWCFYVNRVDTNAPVFREVHRVYRVSGFFPVVRIGSQGSVPPAPFGSKGETHSLPGRGWGTQFRRRDIHSGILCIVYTIIQGCVSIRYSFDTDPDLGFWWPKIEKNYFFWIKNYNLPIPRPP
jgi:hypothetical protein